MSKRYKFVGDPYFTHTYSGGRVPLTPWKRFKSRAEALEFWTDAEASEGYEPVGHMAEGLVEEVRNGVSV